MVNEDAFTDATKFGILDVVNPAEIQKKIVLDGPSSQWVPFWSHSLDKLDVKSLSPYQKFDKNARSLTNNQRESDPTD